MSFLSLFLPRKYTFPNSKYNKNISVLQYLNSTTLAVDGLIESGDVMTRVWKKGITVLLPKTFVPQNVLLLAWPAVVMLTLSTVTSPRPKSPPWRLILS